MKTKLSVIIIALLSLAFAALADTQNGYSTKELEALGKKMRMEIKDSLQAETDYKNYMASRSFSPLKNSRTLFEAQRSSRFNNKPALFIVEENIYNNLKATIDRYIQDVKGYYECPVVLQVVNKSAKAVDLKKLITDEYYSTGVQGVVFIGSLSAAWYEHNNDYDETGKTYSTFPCDLYFMDLNGGWYDTDKDGKFDNHTGDRNPEIFLSRIDVSTLSNFGSEVDLLKRYFDKNHKFYTGELQFIGRRGLTYTDKDFVPQLELTNSMSILYDASNLDIITYPNVSISDYKTRLNDRNYEFIQLACHSSNAIHQMTDGIITQKDIYQVAPKAMIYNLYCCSGMDWTTANGDGYIGANYVYTSSDRALFSLGSAKTGSMLFFASYYTRLAQFDTSLGDGLVLWFAYVLNGSATFQTFNQQVSWYYGMTQQGDPFMCLKRNKDFTPPEIISLENSSIKIGTSSWILKAVILDKSKINYVSVTPLLDGKPWIYGSASMKKNNNSFDYWTNGFFTTSKEGLLDFTVTATDESSNKSSKNFKGKIYDPNKETILFNEEFAKEPTAWTSESVGGTAKWSVNQTKGAGGQIGELVATGANFNGVTRYISPEISLSNYADFWVSFRYSLKQKGDLKGLSVKLQSSIDKQNWVDEDWKVTFPIDSLPSCEYIQPLKNNQSNKVFLAFTVEGDINTLSSLYIDNVKLTGIRSSSLDENSNRDVSLFDSYPNPFNNRTSISFENKIEGRVALRVFNVKGEMVKVLVNSNLQSGLHTVEFDAHELNSGVYYYALTVNNQTITKKTVLIK